MPTIRDLPQLVTLVQGHGEDLFVRWSKGPDDDLAGGSQCSRDELTKVKLPGLSANPLAVEPWWGDRPLALWVARRLYDYSHLRRQRGPGVRAWILQGEITGRGPDNEPLVICRRPIAWVADSVLEDAVTLVDTQGTAEWGPLDRREARPG
jgi:hypothetical protein